MTNILAFFSLSYFLVSPGRKLRLVTLLALLILTLYGSSLISVPHPYLSGLLQIFIVYLVVSIVTTVIRFAVVTAYRRRYRLKAGSYDNVIASTDATASVIVFIVTIGSFFPIFGVPFQSFLTSLGLVAVGLAIMVRDYAKNFIDGFRILYTRDFLIGDYIKTKNGQTGVITDISFQATKVTTIEGDVAKIPNSSLMNGETTNLSKSSHTISVTVTIDNDKLESLEVLERQLHETVTQDFSGIDAKKKVKLLVNKLEKSVIELTVMVPVAHYSFNQETRLNDMILRCAIQYLRAHPVSSKTETDSD